MRHSRGSILVALIAVITMLALVPIWGPPVAARTQPAGLKMTASAAFDGLFKYGEWLPISVELENSGPDLEAEIQVRLVGGGGTSIFAANASLPTGSRKRIPLYVLPNNFTHELQVSLVKDEQTLISQKVAVTPRPNLNYFIGLMTEERGALALLSGITLLGQSRPKELIDLTLADLPERPEGLRSLDCLILNDVDTSALTPEQQLALETWVRQGGRLVIGGGAGAQRTVAGLPADILPFVPRNVTEVDTLPGLASIADNQPVRVPGPFVIATGEEGPGLTLTAQDDLPLVREHLVGSGAVDSVALDLAITPFDAWSGTTAFWEGILSPGAVYPDWIPPDASLRQMRASPMSYALSNLPSLDLPSVRSLAVLLAIYIVLVGPVNYLVLRWRKRLQWAWITIPLLTLAFAGASFGLAYARRGTDLILNKISVIQMLSGDDLASITSYVGLFSPSQHAYEIEVEGGGLLSPLSQDYNPWGPGGLGTNSEMAFGQGDPARVRGLTVNQWSMQSFTAEGVWADLGSVSGDVRIEGDQLVGQVRNGTAYPLTGIVAILGNQFVRLPDMAAGQEVDIALAINSTTSATIGTPLIYRIYEQEMNGAGASGSREVQLKQSVLESVLQPGGWQVEPTAVRLGSARQSTELKSLLLIGWLDQAPPEVRVAGRSPAQKTTALLLVAIPYRIPDEGYLTLPAGLLSGRLASMPAEGGTCGMPGTTGVYIGRGQAIFEFRIPEAMRDMAVDELNLVLGSEGGWVQPPSTAIYNWQNDAWTELQNQSLGANTISDAASLVSAEGLIHVRLSAESGGGCYYVELGFSGTRGR